MRKFNLEVIVLALSALSDAKHCALFLPKQKQAKRFQRPLLWYAFERKGVVMKKAGPLRKKVLGPTLRLPRERQEFAYPPYRFPSRYLCYPYRYRAPHTPERGE
jgi:hypothetical protein